MSYNKQRDQFFKSDMAPVMKNAKRLTDLDWCVGREPEEKENKLLFRDPSKHFIRIEEVRLVQTGEKLPKINRSREATVNASEECKDHPTEDGCVSYGNLAVQHQGIEGTDAQRAEKGEIAEQMQNDDIPEDILRHDAQTDSHLTFFSDENEEFVALPGGQICDNIPGQNKIVIQDEENHRGSSFHQRGQDYGGILLESKQKHSSIPQHFIQYQHGNIPQPRAQSQRSHIPYQYGQDQRDVDKHFEQIHSDNIPKDWGQKQHGNSPFSG